MTDRLPVIIAAKDEERFIGRALERLDRGTTVPFVVTNGSSDRTAEIARGFGARVEELPESGKLPAIQYAMRELGHEALGPVLFMDADSLPFSPKRWASEMMKGMNDDKRAAVVAGTIAFNDGSPIVSALRSFKEVHRTWRIAMSGEAPIDAVYGANMGLRLNTEERLEKILELPHIWPGEDRCIASMVQRWGGDVSVSLSLGGLVLTSARYHTSLLDRIRNGKGAVEDQSSRNYANRAAPAATHKFVDSQLIEL